MGGSTKTATELATTAPDHERAGVLEAGRADHWGHIPVHLEQHGRHDVCGHDQVHRALRELPGLFGPNGQRDVPGERPPARHRQPWQHLFSGDSSGTSSQAVWAQGTFFDDLKKHLLIGRYNPAGSIDVYCDDVLRATNGAGLTPAQATTIVYGALRSGGSVLAEVSNGMAFDRVLSTAEMTLLFGLMK